MLSLSATRPAAPTATKHCPIPEGFTRLFAFTCRSTSTPGKFFGKVGASRPGSRGSIVVYWGEFPSRGIALRAARAFIARQEA